jgi:hypothetical protein
MKTFSSFLVVFSSALLIHTGIYSQSMKIALVHNGVTTIYTNLTPTIAAAQSGDTIYLPGGYIPSTSNPILISKSLTIIGAGHHRDSITATGATIIATDFSYISGADNGKITGCVINNLYFGYNGSGNVNNMNISRCYIGNLHACKSNCTSTSSNIVFSENIIEKWSEGAFYSVVFEKCIMSEPFYVQSATYNNNIFIFYGYVTVSNSILNNCIFINSAPATIWISGSQSTYNNYLFCGSGASYGAVTFNNNVSNNSITGQTLANTFVNVSNASFSYSNNYHLKSTSP